MALSELLTRASRDGFQVGSLSFGSVGPIAFSPDGVLFVADNTRAEIVAIDLSDDERATAVVEVNDLDERLAAFLGCARADVAIRDLAAHPVSQAMFLPVMRGAGDAAVPVLIRVAGDGTLSEVECGNVSYARTAIDHAPAEDDERQEERGMYGIPIYHHLVEEGLAAGEDFELPDFGITLRVERELLREITVTDLAFVDGELLVAGASSEEFVSTLRRIPFPFREGARASALEMYHVNHGKYETHAPVRTFAPYAGGSGILASYTCTPIVHFPVAELVDGARVVGRTVAELGGANTPLDIVSFTRDDGEYLLVSNTRLPLLKIDGRDIDGQEGLTEHREPRGVPREELPHKGVSRMAVVDGQVLMLQRDDAGLHLRSYSSASL
jgi:hypothetical protein